MVWRNLSQEACQRIHHPAVTLKMRCRCVAFALQMHGRCAAGRHRIPAGQEEQYDPALNIRWYTTYNYAPLYRIACGFASFQDRQSRILCKTWCTTYLIKMLPAMEHLLH
jgi:hypothetical protein